jgi:acetolactate decarboxylase
MSSERPDDAARSAFRSWAAMMWAQLHPEGRLNDDGRPGSVRSSTLSALLDGTDHGDVTVAELLRHGDFGLGTFNDLDGEMLILDGNCYRLRADGSATPARSDDLTPFATITHFHADHSFEVHNTPTGRQTLTSLIDAALESPTSIHAIRINGQFTTMRTSAVMEQHGPYPPLTEAIGDLAEATSMAVSGTLAGFRMPYYQQGVSVAGYYLLFLDETRQHGGHALDYEVLDAAVEISVRSELHLSLPRTTRLIQADVQHDAFDEEI